MSSPPRLSLTYLTTVRTSVLPSTRGLNRPADSADTWQLGVARRCNALNNPSAGQPSPKQVASPRLPKLHFFPQRLDSGPKSGQRCMSRVGLISQQIAVACRGPSPKAGHFSIPLHPSPFLSMLMLTLILTLGAGCSVSRSPHRRVDCRLQRPGCNGTILPLPAPPSPMLPSCDEPESSGSP